MHTERATRMEATAYASGSKRPGRSTGPTDWLGGISTYSVSYIKVSKFIVSLPGSSAAALAPSRQCAVRGTTLQVGSKMLSSADVLKI